MVVMAIENISVGKDMHKMTFKIIDGLRPLYIVRWLQFYGNSFYLYRVDGPASTWQSDDGHKEYFYYDHLYSKPMAPADD